MVIENNYIMLIIFTRLTLFCTFWEYTRNRHVSATCGSAILRLFRLLFWSLFGRFMSVDTTWSTLLWAARPLTALQFPKAYSTFLGTVHILWECTAIAHSYNHPLYYTQHTTYLQYVVCNINTTNLLVSERTLRSTQYGMSGEHITHTLRARAWV